MATFACPVCGSPAKIYASRPFSDTAREMFLACSNERCEHSFRSRYDILNTILPSALPEDDPERLPPGATPVMRMRFTKGEREARERAREKRQHAIARLKQVNSEQEARTRMRLAWLREETGTAKQTARAIGCTEEELKCEGPISEAFARAVKDAYERLQR